jgi:hypothetical protein
MTRSFKISGSSTVITTSRRAVNRAARMHLKVAAQDDKHYGNKLNKRHQLGGNLHWGRLWYATEETYEPDKPHQKFRTPMDIKGSNTPRNHTKKRFYINVDHQTTFDKENELQRTREDAF